MLTPDIDHYLQENEGKAVTRLWAIICDLRNQTTPREESSGTIKWTLSRSEIRDRLTQKEGVEISDNTFKQRINRLRTGLKNSLETAEKKDHLLEITLSEKKPDHFFVSFVIDVSAELEALTKDNTAGVDPHIIPADIQLESSLSKRLQNPVKILLSHAHSDVQDIQDIKKHFYDYLVSELKNLPAEYSDLDCEIIYDVASLKPTQGLDEFTKTSAAQSAFAIFIASNNWRDSPPCQKELSFFFDRENRKAYADRRCLFIAESSEYTDLGQDFANRLNWIGWYAKKAGGTFSTLVKFWPDASPAEKLSFIHSVRDSILSSIRDLQDYLDDPAVRSKNIDPDAIMSREEQEKYYLADAHKSLQSPERFPVQSALMKWAGFPDSRQEECPDFSTRFMVLLGDFGSGKTTGLKYFCRQLIEKRKKDPHSPLPIYLNLREMVSEVDRDNSDQPLPLTTLILKGMSISNNSSSNNKAELVERWLYYIRTHPCIVVLDGLDEVGNSIGNKAADRLLNELLNILPPNVWQRDQEKGNPDWDHCPTRLVLSCRTHFFRDQDQETVSLSAHYRHSIFGDKKEQFSRLYMAPFTLDQIKGWLEKNLGSNEGAAAFEKMQRLHDLLGLATRPILLRLITESLDDIARDYQDGKPLNNALIYDKVFRRAIKRDDYSKSLQIQVWEKIAILRSLAQNLWLAEERALPADQLDQWFMRQGSQHLDIQPNWKEQRDSFLTELHTSNLLVRQGDNLFGFAHTSFFEFFLAQVLWHILIGDIDLPEDISLPPISTETSDFFYEYAELASLQARKKAGKRIAYYFTGSQEHRQFWFKLLLQNYTPARAKLLDITDLSQLDLSGLNLAHWQAEGLRLANCRLEDSSLTAAKWKNVHLSNCQITGAMMGSGDYRHCHFMDCQGRPRELASSLFQSCHFIPSHKEDWQDIRLANQDCQGLSIQELAIKQLSSPESPELVYALGHSHAVTSICFSPDGQQIVTASADGTARVWDWHSGQEIKILSGHEGWVLSACFSSDGQQIVTASDDRTARVWDWRSGQEIKILSGHEDWVRSAGFSSDGQQIVTASHDGTARVWDWHSGQEIKVLSGHESAVNSACFSPDGQQIVTASHDKTVRVWDRHSGQEIKILSGHEGWVLSACFSPDGQQIVTTSRDRTARVWDWRSGQEIKILSGHEDWVRSACFSPDGQQIVTASIDGTARLWDSRSGQEIKILSGHEDAVVSAGFSPDGQQIVTASDDMTVRLWDSRSGQAIKILSGYVHWVRSACFSPDGQLIVSEDMFGHRKVWNVMTGQEIDYPEEKIKSIKKESSTWNSNARETDTLFLEEQGGCVMVKDKTSNTTLYQFTHLPEGWAVANKDGIITAASPDAWPYLRCRVENPDGSFSFFAADQHPDWEKIFALS